MSVTVPDIEVFEAIFVKIIDYTHNKKCDINYCHVFSGFDELKAGEFVKNILFLNELSYIKRYPEEGKPEEAPELFKMLNLRYRGESIDSVQMYKYLQCIEYNIEIETIKQGRNSLENNTIPSDKMESYKTLQQAINAIGHSIVVAKTNYNDLKWSAA